ncbi:hypothetical protein ACHAW6_012014 [Cyclotella cf. meneghiniana]
MPSFNNTNKPISNLLADRVANKSSDSDKSGESKRLSSIQSQHIPSGGASPRQSLHDPNAAVTDADLTSEAYPCVYALNKSDGSIQSSLTASEVPFSEFQESNHVICSGSTKKNKASRRRSQERRSSATNDGKKKNNFDTGTEVRSKRIRRERDVSFSGSTVQRLDEKETLKKSSESLLQTSLRAGKFSNDGMQNRRMSSVSDMISITMISLAPQSEESAALGRRKLDTMREISNSKTNPQSQPIRQSKSEPDKNAGEDVPKPTAMSQCRSAPNLATFESPAMDSNQQSTSCVTTKSRKNVRGRNAQPRRRAIRMDNQIYIPPKNRNASILQPIAHLMAGRITDLLLWTYSASFARVVLFFLAVYVSNIFTWALVIMAADTTNSVGSSCIYGDESGHSTTAARYEIAFDLSWSTFTTVGYGAVGPLSESSGCYAIRLICALVSFIGVLFASTTAAILYFKLIKLLVKAQVTFSSSLCVQYGTGIDGSSGRIGQLIFSSSSAAENTNAPDLPRDSYHNKKSAGSSEGYPVMEFRMVNDRANRQKSEIWDAQIRGVVQLIQTEQPKEDVASLSRAKAIEGESSLDLEPVVFHPVKFTPDSHPHFRHVWYARHVLNAESPLVKRELRDIIARDGKWDEDFNSWQEIRNILNPFVSLRITFSGTTALSPETVHSEHIYEFDDVFVGWRFANMAFKESGKSWKSWLGIFGFRRDDRKDRHSDKATNVNMALIHDIVPQPGDDHEPLGEDQALDGIVGKLKFW